VGFELTIPASEQAKIFGALDLEATVIGKIHGFQTNSEMGTDQKV
jgi:hypothetical protein